MRPAPTQNWRQGLDNFQAGRVRITIQESLRRHDHAVRAVAALSRLRSHERFLKRMWPLNGT
jgi:hypothetical protein